VILAARTTFATVQPRVAGAAHGALVIRAAARISVTGRRALSAARA
jgi:hypothetical protein